MKQTSVRERRKFDETFKREAVQKWLASGDANRPIMLTKKTLQIVSSFETDEVNKTL